MEICTNCKRKYDVIWTVSDDLWLLINGTEGGTLCPHCFDEIFFEKTKRKLYWECKVDDFPIYKKGKAL
jgi:hypothetical protein